MNKNKKSQLQSLSRRQLIKLASFLGSGLAVSGLTANRISGLTPPKNRATVAKYGTSSVPHSTNQGQLNSSNLRTAPKIELKSFNFETVILDPGGQIINRTQKQAQYFVETISQGIILDMVALPGGTFLMGAAEEEKSSLTNSDKPQHQVTVNPFYMSKYPITQAQWKAIATLPQIERDLNPTPSYFQGDDLPVEQVSWYDAVEFCARLTQLSGKNYQLPSEAQWEYACRGKTTTPFYFGATLIGQLANYFSSNDFYTVEPPSEFRQKTTVVGIFPPNDFGLYDLHGNVYEWCADVWHNNYEKAPNDGSVWLSDQPKNNRYRVLRGGGWATEARQCRSAHRTRFGPNNQYSTIGFRVVIA